MNETTEDRIASVYRELAEFKAHDEALRSARPTRARNEGRRSATSMVFSVRLDPAEVAALEARAAAVGIGPTVLARNLIRIGLTSSRGDDLGPAVDQLEAAVAQLRAIEQARGR